MSEDTVMPRLAAHTVLFDFDNTIVANTGPGQVEPYPDAVETIRELHRRGYRLYPATTNAACVCLDKLGKIGLAESNRCQHFVDLFGGDEVCPGGKTTPTFFTELLKRIDADPDDVIMVGDLPHIDLAFAQAAGIQQVVLPRRDQAQDVILEPDGGIYVRSLTSLLDWLPPRQCDPSA